jgi:adenylate/guanylate cyclase family protein
VGSDQSVVELDFAAHTGKLALTASCMESQGIPGRIQVTQRFYECLQAKGKFRFEKRGVISVKGKGDRTVYLLKGSVGTEQKNKKTASSGGLTCCLGELHVSEICRVAEIPRNGTPRSGCRDQGLMS